MTKEYVKCLKENEVCSNNNLKCKECKLKDCKKVIEMLEDLEKREYDLKINKIKAQLPNNCKECTILKIINIDKQKVYCPYMIQRKCVLI